MILRFTSRYLNVCYAGCAIKKLLFMLDSQNVIVIWRQYFCSLCCNVIMCVLNICALHHIENMIFKSPYHICNGKHYSFCFVCYDIITVQRSSLHSNFEITDRIKCTDDRFIIKYEYETYRQRTLHLIKYLEGVAFHHNVAETEAERLF